MKKAHLIVGLALVVLLVAVSAAFAAPQTENGVSNGATPPKYIADLPVTVNASVPMKFVLTLDQDTINAGSLDPDVAAPQWTSPVVNIDTKTNVLATLTSAVTGTVNGAGEPTFVNSIVGDTTNIRGNNAFTDQYQMGVDYDVDPGAYQAIVTYTLLQD